MEKQKIEVRCNIKFLVKLGWKKSDIIESVRKVYGDTAPKKTTCYEWINRFSNGLEGIEDGTRSGRPSTSINNENISRVRELVEEDRRYCVEFIAGNLDISVGSTHSILKDHLRLSKLSARWVPKLLQEMRTNLSIQTLNKWDANPDDFLQRIVTGDETWLYQYDPEDKQQSKQWLPRGSSGPIKGKAERSVAKIMATIFWDSEGVLLIDYLEGQRTVNAIYYERVLEKLHQAIKKKRQGKLHARVLFHHDNAPAHSSRLVRAKLRDLRWELLSHPPYSPDLAPSDFFLFPNLKKHLKGTRFSSIEEVKKQQRPGSTQMMLNSTGKV